MTVYVHPAGKIEKIHTFEYIEIWQNPQEGKRKTRDYLVVNRKSNIIIAFIDYESGWRQHVLKPQPETIWSAGCLEDVIKFMKELKK